MRETAWEENARRAWATQGTFFADGELDGELELRSCRAAELQAGSEGDGSSLHKVARGVGCCCCDAGSGNAQALGAREVAAIGGGSPSISKLPKSSYDFTITACLMMP